MRGSWLTQVLRMGFPRPADHLLIALLCAYLLAALLGCGPWVSVLVALGFGFSSLNILYLGAGHAAKVMSIATLPGILAGVLVAYRRNLWLGAGVACAFTAINMAANHLQMTYYLAFLVGGIGIAETVRLVRSGAARQAIVTAGVLLAAAGVAILPNAALIGPTLDYTPHTTRGEVLLSPLGGVDVGESGLDKDYILQYSMGRGEFWSVLVPDIKGGNNPLYWGEQLFSGGAFYFGAILIALFMVSLVLRRDVLRWPMLVVALLAIVLSWRDASGLTDFFLDSVPGFAKFRDTKMMLMLIQCMLPIGVGLLLKDALEGKVEWGGSSSSPRAFPWPCCWRLPCCLRYCLTLRATCVRTGRWSSSERPVPSTSVWRCSVPTCGAASDLSFSPWVGCWPWCGCVPAGPSRPSFTALSASLPW